MKIVISPVVYPVGYYLSIIHTISNGVIQRGELKITLPLFFSLLIQIILKIIPLLFNILRLRVILLVALLPFYCFGQQTMRIRIVDANELRFDRRLGSEIKRLLGNVILEHEGALMYCDSAYLYENTNSFDAFNRVRIKSGDTLNLYGDRLTYNGNTRIAEVINNVKLIDRETTLTTPILLYDRNTGIAFYEQGGVIIDGNNKLTSHTGYYMTNEKRIHFRKNVVLLNPEYVMNSDTLVYLTTNRVSYFHGPSTIKAENTFIYCQNGWYDTRNDKAQFKKDAYIVSGEHTLRGDSLFYDRINEIGKGFDNVQITDTVQNILLAGNYGEYYKQKGYTFITQKSMAVFVEGSDSLYMHADTIRAYFDSAQNVKHVKAYSKAKFYRDDLQGMCDSLVYNVADSIIEMHRKPVIWTGENQLTADTIHIKTTGESVEWLTLSGSSFIINRDDSTSFNQVKGRNMTGYFVDNKLNNIRVQGNAQTIYYVREDDGSLLGINKAISSNMRIELKNNKIVKIFYFEKPVASITPEDEMPAMQRLLGNFNWQEALRPKEWRDIFKRD
ncbi:MAG: OstA-like protein [Bacteroidales bacterium]|nr:OstA-like protein [Bacteroidales bacterium]